MRNLAQNLGFLLFTAIILLNMSKAHAVAEVSPDSPVIRLPIKAIPKTLDNTNYVHVDQFRIGALLTDSLFEFGENLQLDPKLAKSIEWDKSRSRFLIELRDVSFANGKPIHAKDVISSITRCIRTSKKDITDSFSKIVGYDDFVEGKRKTPEGLKALSAHRLAIYLNEPSPLIVENLAMLSCAIVLPNAKGSTNLFAGALGSGPYTIDKINKSVIRLKKRANYYGISSGPNTIEFLATNNFGNLKALKDKMDLIVLDEEAPEVEGYNRFRYSRMGNWQLSFNNSKAPFNQKNLRLAVAKAIDYKLLSESMGWLPSRMQAGIFPFGMAGFVPRDLEKRELSEANRILKSLGYSRSNPFRFTLILSTRNGAKKEAEIWRKVFAGSYIDVTVQLLEHKELIERRRSGDFQVMRNGKAPGSIDAHLLLASYLAGSRFNTPRVNLPKCESKIRLALNTVEREQRRKRYVDAETCLMAEQVIVPLASLNPGWALLKKPWKIRRTNQYLLYPYYANEWRRED